MQITLERTVWHVFEAKLAIQKMLQSISAQGDLFLLAIQNATAVCVCVCACTPSQHVAAAGSERS